MSKWVTKAAQGLGLSKITKPSKMNYLCNLKTVAAVCILAGMMVLLLDTVFAGAYSYLVSIIGH